MSAVERETKRNANHGAVTAAVRDFLEGTQRGAFAARFPFR